MASRTVSGEDEHPSGDQLMADASGRPYQNPAVMPAASARMSLRPSAIWQLLDGFVQVAALTDVPHRGRLTDLELGSSRIA
jgi:hypothetical protein